MASQRIRLSKKIFMSLKPGQYIMDNCIPSKYEEIDKDLKNQWIKWKNNNNNIVNIFDSKDECLSACNINHSLNDTNLDMKSIFKEKISKKKFMEIKSGHFILFTQGNLEYFELNENREKQWLECRYNNGRMVVIFNNINDLILYRNDIISLMKKKYGMENV